MVLFIDKTSSNITQYQECRLNRTTPFLILALGAFRSPCGPTAAPIMIDHSALEPLRCILPNEPILWSIPPFCITRAVNSRYATKCINGLLIIQPVVHVSDRPECLAEEETLLDQYLDRSGAESISNCTWRSVLPALIRLRRATKRFQVLSVRCL